MKQIFFICGQGTLDKCVNKFAASKAIRLGPKTPTAPDL